MSPSDRNTARDRWRGVKEQQLELILSSRGRRLFERLRDKSALLREHASPDALLDWLRAKTDGRGRDDRDALLRELLRLARFGSDEAGCAWALLFLAFWVPLDRLFLKVVADAGDAAVGEVLDAFNNLVVRLNLVTVNKVAAALAMGTKRDVLRELRQVHRHAQRHGPIPSEDLEGGVLFPADLTCWPRIEDPSPELDLVEFRKEIAAEVGEGDADLVVGAALYGVNQRVMADRLGISYESARKRRQRTIQHLEQGFAKARRRQGRCPNAPGGLRLQLRTSRGEQ